MVAINVVLVEVMLVGVKRPEKLSLQEEEGEVVVVLRGAELGVDDHLLHPPLLEQPVVVGGGWWWGRVVHLVRERLPLVLGVPLSTPHQQLPGL